MSLLPLSRIPATRSTYPLLRASSPYVPISSSPSISTTTQRCFHASPCALIKAGDSLPSIGPVLMENSPGNKVDLAAEAGQKGKALIIGVPAAFSPSCSQSHIPGYINHPALKSSFPGGKVFVLSINDAFVMKAWADSLDPSRSSGIRFLADPSGAYTSALELDFDGAKAIFGGSRSKRYAMVVEDGKVAGEVRVEGDNTGLDVSTAEKVLGPR